MPRITTLRLTMILISLALLVQAVPTRSAQAAGTCPTPSSAIKPGMSDNLLTFDALKRRYLLYIPTTYDPSQPTPLVFSMHGYASYPEEQQKYSRWEKVADNEPLIVVYPQGTGIPLRWNAGDSSYIGANRADDVGFIRQVVITVSEQVCIDPARVYINGLSNGGGMSNRLACEASDIVAAMGGVSGAYSPVECDIKRPVSVIAFHGTTDPLVDYRGNSSENLPDINTWAKDWAERDGCALTPEKIAATGDASGIRYTGCKDKAEVVLYIIEDGGHTWPGSDRKISALGKTSKDIDATAVMWEFFKQHPLE